ncbi:MAG: helix-turn-helix domain-containing protein [Anaerococcus vaginalis]|uniref:helix-turn-helix domain-containing protein n=1 Tax=Anaerococcus vaginalis TaxID=33037 RepID=UPI0029114734|nr:helix-turn-helix domain-containing protein [Anaerococcus vaginalis]MDU6182137.1 helix-turn-helix domain-containing protein [Anaerococcus vaginalis]
MEITNRQKKIIGILLESKDTITCQEIAEIINVSDRTVLNEVNSINKKLSDGNRLTVAKGKGIKLNRNTTIYELHKLYNSEDENEILIKRFINTLLINNYFKQKNIA